MNNTSNNNTLASICIPFTVAQILKKLGVPQKCLFYYEDNTSWSDAKEPTLRMWYDKNSQMLVGNSVYAAFTLQELGELLPAFIMRNGNKYHLYTHKYSYDENIQYFIYYAIENETNNSCAVEDHYSELLARASMLIWLIENGYVKCGESYITTRSTTSSTTHVTTDG